MLIQEHKNQKADLNETVRDKQEKIIKLEMEYGTARRTILNLEETNKRMREQLADQMSKINQYRIETEELIKQIDIADAKTKEKEAEIMLMQAECDRKLKM